MSQYVILCAMCLLVYYQSCCADVPGTNFTNINNSTTVGSVSDPSNDAVSMCILNVAMDRVDRQFGETLEMIKKIQRVNERRPSSAASKAKAFIESLSCRQLYDEATRRAISDIYSGFNSNLAVVRNESKSPSSSKNQTEYDIDQALYKLQRNPTSGVVQVVNLVGRPMTSKLKSRRNKKNPSYHKCLTKRRGHVHFIRCVYQVVAQNAADAVAVHGAYATRLTSCGIPTDVTSCFASAPSEQRSSDSHWTPTYAIILAVVGVFVALCLIAVVAFVMARCRRHQWCLMAVKAQITIRQNSAPTSEPSRAHFIRTCSQSPTAAVTVLNLNETDHEHQPLRA